MSTKPGTASSLVVVSSAVIRDAAGRFLCTLRSSTRDFAYHWEFPGGQLNPDETPSAALTRELWEEIRVSAIPNAFLTRIHFAYERRQLQVYFFSVDLRGVHPVPNLDEGVLGYAWFTADELRDLQVIPGVRLFMAAHHWHTSEADMVRLHPDTWHEVLEPPAAGVPARARFFLSDGSHTYGCSIDPSFYTDVPVQLTLPGIMPR